MDNAINSHIQLPKGILKQFRSSPNNKILHLDLENNRIRSCGEGDLGTEKGYYSQKVEKCLNDKIERPFLNLSHKVRSFLDGNEASLVLQDLLAVESIIKRFVHTSFFRSDFNYKVFEKYSITAPLFDEQSNHDFLVWYSINRDAGSFLQLDNYKMLVLTNNTEMNFVIPRNCVYAIHSNKHQCIVCPISPICAFVLVPQEYSGPLCERELSRLANIDNSTDVIIMNEHALHFEYTFNKKFVASATRPELELLQEYVEKHHDTLERNRQAMLKMA